MLLFSYSQENNNVLIHSHNDYKQEIPFWNAYANNLNIIEVDIIFKNDKLYVAHEESEILEYNTLESLYLNPIKYAIENKVGTIHELTLMLDVKSEANSTISRIVESLNLYPKITKHPEISIVVSGKRPDSSTYNTYPNYINFDHQELENNLTESNWKKVAMVSLSFNVYSNWNGKGRLTHDDYNKVTRVIEKAKKLNKPFRFWATPDSKTAWKTFSSLGVNIINTDKPYLCSSFLKNFRERKIKNTTISKVYKPTFKKDKKSVKNIILLIGDGNGLSQISSAVLANKGELSLTQLKNIGFIKTQAADDFTTDSAAAGTALATGKKTNNRAIGTNVQNQPIKNLTEVLSEKKFKTGVITTDEITGATPASFYAHQTDRSKTIAIAKDLVVSKLNFFAGGGKNTFKNIPLNSKFKIAANLKSVSSLKSKKIGVFLGEKKVPSMIDGRGNLLSDATKVGLQFLSKGSSPFFLMIESAKIDSFGHENNVKGIVSEVIDFDRAITEAIKFADKDGETLVIITADHETSGFGIIGGDLSDKTIEGDFITHDHTGTMVPIFAYGPKSNLFTGVYENNEVFHKILQSIEKE